MNCKKQRIKYNKIMNILIVDGNEKIASENYTNLGMETQYEVYAKVIRKLFDDNNLNISIIHPAIEVNFIPSGLSLDDFDGIAWTGSVLNIYDETPSIIRQVHLAKSLLDKNNHIFGSCWGLQVLVTAAGGKIRKNPNGIEAVVAKDISINDYGTKHPMYKGKKKIFDSFCWHYDDTETLPENTSVLASNLKSKIQSISFNNNQSKVWAVQYHPEFDPAWMAGLMIQREKILLELGVYKTKDEFNSYKNYFSNIEKNSDQKNTLNISDTLIDKQMHSIELLNWINCLKDRR